MKLINFLETLEQKKVKRNLKPQLIKDNFYYINGVSFREMNNLIKKIQFDGDITNLKGRIKKN